MAIYFHQWKLYSQSSRKNPIHLFYLQRWHSWSPKDNKKHNLSYSHWWLDSCSKLKGKIHCYYRGKEPISLWEMRMVSDSMYFCIVRQQKRIKYIVLMNTSPECLNESLTLDIPNSQLQEYHNYRWLMEVLPNAILYIFNRGHAWLMWYSLLLLLLSWRLYRNNEFSKINLKAEFKIQS